MSDADHVNHEFIDRFRALHGHSPWLICGFEADCLLDADHVPQSFSPDETQERNNP